MALTMPSKWKQRPIVWIARFLGAACCCFVLVNALQYLRAREVLRVGRDLELGSPVSPDQLRKLSVLLCGPSRLTSPGAQLASVRNFQCNIPLILPHRTGLEETELVTELVVRDQILVRKSVWLYYGDRHGVAVSQDVRGYGYVETPALADDPHPTVYRIKGITHVVEDDQLPRAKLRNDWNIPLSCLWRDSACEAWALHAGR